MGVCCPMPHAKSRAARHRKGVEPSPLRNGGGASSLRKPEGVESARWQAGRAMAQVARGRYSDLPDRAATCWTGSRGSAVSTAGTRSEEHTSELQSLMRNSYAVFCLKKQKTTTSKSNKIRQDNR